MKQEPDFTLTTIRFSHYNEKVRWTLDRLGLVYMERPLMPIIHFAVTPFASGGKGRADTQSSRYSTPILRIENGDRFTDSSRIMRYLSDRFLGEQDGLFPEPKVAELDEHYNRYLGPHTRRFFYHHVLPRQDLMFEIADRNVPAAQARLFKLIFPFCRDRIIGALGVTEDRVRRSLGYIYKEFDEVEQRLKDGRPYLFGDRLTAADISFACLGGAALLPSPAEGYGAYLPAVGGPCAELNGLAEELRETNAGKWVLNLYRTERGQRQLFAEPPLL